MPAHTNGLATTGNGSASKGVWQASLDEYREQSKLTHQQSLSQSMEVLLDNGTGSLLHGLGAHATHGFCLNANFERRAGATDAPKDNP